MASKTISSFDDMYKQLYSFQEVEKKMSAAANPKFWVTLKKVLGDEPAKPTEPEINEWGEVCP